MPSKLDEMHYIAEKFLLDYEATQAASYTTEVLEVANKKVVIVRATKPQYFVGQKADGTSVWSYDRKLAKVLGSLEADAWLQALKREGFEVTGEQL